MAVYLDAYAAAQVVLDEDLLGLGEAEFPGQAGVFDRGLRRGARAPVVPADEDQVRLALGHAGRNGADTRLCDELD